MEYFIVVDSKVIVLTKEEFENILAIDVNEYIKGMSLEQLEAFKKARYENFIKPLMK